MLALSQALAREDEAIATMLRDAGTRDPALRSETRRLRRAQRRGAALSEQPPIPLPAEWAAVVQRRAGLHAEIAAARDQAETIAREELAASRDTLARLVRDDRVLAAARLSSRSLARALERGIAPGSGRTGARQRALERRALLFLQRIAGKNEMLAFLGPCLWGRIEPEGQSSLVTRDEPLQSHLFFEYWALRALARRVESDPEIARYCRPRMNPACALEGTTLYYPIAHRSTLEPAQLRVLGACDGRSLDEIRADLAQAPDAAALQEALDGLLERGILDPHIALPAVDPRPEVRLRAFLDGLPDACTSKAKWSAALAQLCDLRSAVASATTRDQRTAAEDALDSAFQKLTGLEPERGAGKIAGARYVTYQDCARPVELTLGRGIHDDLQRLEPLFEVGSWIARACAAEYEKKLLPIYRRLASGLDSVDFIRFVRETAWVTDPPEVQTRVRGVIADAWQRRIGDRSADAAVEITEDDVRAVLAELPPVAPAPWLPAADVHTASVLLGAADPAALERGDYRLVLGKLYKGVPLFAHAAARPFCPDPAGVDRALSQWLREPLLQLVDPPSGYHRSNLNLPDVAGIYEALTPDAWSRFPAERTLATGQLEVTEDGGHLHVRTRDGRLQVGLMSVRWSFLQGKLLAVSPLPLAEAQTAPRITMGKWVLARRRWTVPTEGLVRRSSLPAVREWQAEQGIPDLVFVRSPEEPKSVFIDLRSALYAELLVALARRVPSLALTEMAPTPDEAWLQSGSDRYLCELRLTALSAARGTDAAVVP